MTISGKLALRVILSRKSLSLIALGVCIIIASVFLMNLEHPRVAAHSRIYTYKDTPDNVTAPEKQPLPVKDSRPAETSAPTPLSAQSVVPNSDPAQTIKGLLIPVSGVTANKLR